MIRWICNQQRKIVALALGHHAPQIVLDFWPITVVGTQNLFLSTCLHRLWRKVHFITLRQSSSRVPFLGLQNVCNVVRSYGVLSSTSMVPTLSCSYFQRLLMLLYTAAKDMKLNFMALQSKQQRKRCFQKIQLQNKQNCVERGTMVTSQSRLLIALVPLID